jgi:hypothetical protein
MAVRAFDNDDENSDPAYHPFEGLDDDSFGEDTYEVLPRKLSREAEIRANKEMERVLSRGGG